MLIYRFFNIEMTIIMHLDLQLNCQGMPGNHYYQRCFSPKSSGVLLGSPPISRASFGTM